MTTGHVSLFTQRVLTECLWNAKFCAGDLIVNQMWSLPSWGTQAGGRHRDVTLVLQSLRTSLVLSITPIFQALFFFLLGSPVYEEFSMWPPFWCYTETHHSGASKRQATGRKPRSLSWDDWHLGKEHPKAKFFVYQSALERDMAYYLGQNRSPPDPQSIDPSME